jgi:hypothetical protein
MGIICIYVCVQIVSAGLLAEPVGIFLHWTDSTIPHTVYNNNSFIKGRNALPYFLSPLTI